jgi:hypothetical protein
MAVRTGCRKLGSLVVRICSGSIIGLMTINALIGNFCEGSAGMAFYATQVSMTLGQWKEIVVYIGGIPCKTVH